jgi:NAD(P)-dependent dehydrogenase (short-subunit alcohol dehydrogenase family)
VAGAYARSAWRRPAQLPAALRQATSSAYVAAFQLHGPPERVWSRRADQLWGKALGDGGVPAGDPLLAFGRDDILAIALPGLELYRQNLRPDRMPDAPADGSVTVATQLVVALGDTYVRPPLARASAALCTDLVVREVAAGHWVQRSHPDELAGWVDTMVAGAEGGPAPAAFEACARPVPALAGRVVLVTGAGGGIGRATAVDAAEAGATLVLADRSAEGLAETAECCRSLGADVDEHVVDVTDRAAMTAFADAVHARHGAVDVLVNNAGVGMAGPFTAMSLDDWDWIRSVNLDGVVLGCHLFVPAMVAAGRGGHVVNVASAAGLAPARNMTAYNATKFAVVGLSDALAADLAGAGIAVSAICPGIVDTGIIGATRFVGDDAAEETRDRIGRLYRRRGFGPEKVSAAIWSTVAAGRSGVVPVGPEATALYRLRRFAPRLLARLAGRDLAGTDRAGSPTTHASALEPATGGAS